MYDYRMVFVYPLGLPVDDLSELEDSALSQLEDSISKTVDDGWEYMSTTTFSKPKSNDPASQEHNLKAFVYRRFRGVSAEFTGPAAAALMKPVKKSTADWGQSAELKPKNRVLARKKTTLLTMALLNAVHAHSKIEPEAILPKLKSEGEISDEEEKLLAATLTQRLSAAEVATITPSGQEKDVFRVSLMPFGDEDGEYADYLAELAVYLDLDDAFIARETAQKRL